MKESLDNLFFGSVTVGERGQIVIPADARQALDLKPGDKLLVMRPPYKDGLMISKIEDVAAMVEMVKAQLDQAVSEEDGSGGRHDMTVAPWLMLGVAMAVSSQPFPQQDDGLLTLDEALQIAEAQAFSVRLQGRNIEIADASVKVAEAALLPGAQATGRSQWSYSNTSGGFGQDGSLFSNSVGVSVSKLIDISGVYRNRILSARFRRDSEEAAFRASLNLVRGDVKTAFFSVVQTWELVQVQRATLESAKVTLQNARIREQEGEIPRFDVLRFELEVKQAEQAVSDAEGDYELAKQNLNNVLGRPIETEFEVESSPDLPTVEKEREELVVAALRVRPEIEQSELGIRALEETTKAEGKAGAPELAVSGSYTKNIDPAFGQSDDQTAFGLQLTWPITIRGVVAANARISKEQTEQARIQFEQVQLGIALEVQAAMTEYQNAVRNYETSVVNVELAEEALRLAQLRYDEQVGILLDVTTSRASLNAAQASLVIAAFDIRKAFANLQEAVGQDDLNNIEEELEKKDQ